MGAFVAWLHRQRHSTRLAFILQVGTRILSAVMSLLWTPLLLEAMGARVNGIWLSFQVFALAGGLSDLGMGGAVGVRTGQLLAQRQEESLANFLAGARALFLLLALFITAAFLAAAPWLHRWLGFAPSPGTGSLTLLFAMGALGFLPLVLSSYINNVNYACGNLTWPILPSFLLSQASLACHWLLARQQAPLWLQYVPYLVGSAVSLLLMWSFLRISHPSLAPLRPFRFCRSDWAVLARQSFWMYFWSLGYFVYVAIDRLLINAGFDPVIIPTYHNNYKACELALFAILCASFMSMPKITRWLAAPEAAERARGLEELQRLNRVQVFLSLAAVLAYLALNDWFVSWWIGREFRADLSWQFAFALSLAVTGCAETAVQAAPRLGEAGMRVAGISVGITAAINAVLSFIAMKFGSIFGIALATAAAQSGISLWISRYVCAQLGLSWTKWVWRSWLMPVAVVSIACAVRFALPLQSWNAVWLGVIYGSLLLIVAGVTRITPAFFASEWKTLRSIAGKA